MISLGVPFGTNNQVVPCTVSSGIPDSLAVGRSGAPSIRSGDVTARILNVAGPMKCEQLSIDRWNRHWNLPTNQIGDRGASSTIGHMDDIRGTDKQFEPLAGQMVQAADAGRSIRQFARIAFGVVRKLLQCPNRQRRIDGNRLSDVTEYGNRIEASNRIIRHVNSCDAD